VRAPRLPARRQARAPAKTLERGLHLRGHGAQLLLCEAARANEPVRRAPAAAAPAREAVQADRERGAGERAVLRAPRGRARLRQLRLQRGQEPARALTLSGARSDTARVLCPALTLSWIYEP